MFKLSIDRDSTKTGSSDEVRNRHNQQCNTINIVKETLGSEICVGEGNRQSKYKKTAHIQS